MILNDRYLIQEQIQKSSWINVYVVEDQLTSKLYIAKEVLKESNPILIPQFHGEVVDEEIYLIDFNACLEKTSHQAILASKVNMAPEFLETGYLDQTSDIYGMGGILLALYSRGPCRKLAQKCRDTLPSKRIRSMKQLKRCFLLCCRAKYILSIIIWYSLVPGSII